MQLKNFSNEKKIIKFLILSHGKAATNWLSKSLNFNTRINCSSGFNRFIKIPHEINLITKDLNKTIKSPKISELMRKNQ